MNGLRLSKKGLGIGQVFIFIVAALTFALIMIFGYKSITQFIEKGEQIEFVQFKSDLESSIKRIYSQYGARSTQQFTLPGKYEQICFVDLEANEETPGQVDQLCTKNQAACLAWQDALAVTDPKEKFAGVDENVFLT